MRFLVDANLPRSVVGLLIRCGHEVEFARDIGLAAVADEHVATRARETNATLLTRDLDFADVRRTHRASTMASWLSAYPMISSQRILYKYSSDSSGGPNLLIK